MVIENNEIFNCGSGIFLKSVQPNVTAPITVRYNLIHGVQTGIAYHIVFATPAFPTRIYQNIIRDGVVAPFNGGTPVGIKLRAFNATNGPIHGKIVNNVVENFEVRIMLNGDQAGGNANVLWNNILTQTQYALVNTGASTINFTSTVNDFEHNLYHQFSTAFLWHTSFIPFATWQSTYGQDAAVPVSSVADPLFVEADANDFHLQTNSAARNSGVDYLDLDNDGSTTDSVNKGAYLTGHEVIGVITDGSPPPPPPSGSRCDVDASGSTTVVDVQLCVNQAIGTTACSTGDINQDSVCNVIDIQRVVNAALGSPCISP